MRKKLKVYLPKSSFKLFEKSTKLSKRSRKNSRRFSPSSSAKGIDIIIRNETWRFA
jgi:hypothetical protein